MRKKIFKKSFSAVIAWVCVQMLFSLGSAGAFAGEISCLSPLLQLELPAIKQGFLSHLINYVSYSQAAEKTAAERDTQIQEAKLTEQILEVKALLHSVEKETAAPGSVILPAVEVMSDFHGEIDLFLKYVADVISQKAGRAVFLDHSKFPQESIEDQLREQGVDIAWLGKKVKMKFHLLGDFTDRGRYGIKCFRAAEELKVLGIADIVTGNHDLLALMASMGYHLPIYKGYNLYGHKESEKLVFETHWDDPEIAKDRFGWWSIKLAEFVKERKAMQQGFFSVNGEENIKDVRENLKRMYINIQDQLAADEKELWEELVGFFFGTTNVATGFNDIGMMSVQWWQERAEKVDMFLQQAYKKAHLRRISSRESAHEIIIWEDLKEYVKEALSMVEEQLNRAKKEGKWWHQVFNDINNQIYTSPEWYAVDWLFHELWGTSVIAELNELELNKDVVWDTANFMNNKNIQDFAAFFRKNFTLYLQDKYGFYYTHGWFPVNMDTGQIEFTYKGVLYRGKNIWQGLDAIQDDVLNENNSFTDLQEAFTLVMSWYADKTTGIKPEHIKEYIKKFGIRAIQESIGAGVWFTCHNPLNTLSPKGIMFKEQEGDYVHISVDKGMSWKKFKDVGGYVVVDNTGIKLRGFSNAEFKEIIDYPQTMNLIEEEDKVWTTIYIQENKPLDKQDFLIIAKKQLESKLQLLEKQLWRDVISVPLMPQNYRRKLSLQTKFAEQAI